MAGERACPLAALHPPLHPREVLTAPEPSDDRDMKPDGGGRPFLRQSSSRKPQHTALASDAQILKGSSSSASRQRATAFKRSG
jgi:hypothetical protein